LDACSGNRILLRCFAIVIHTDWGRGKPDWVSRF